MRLFTFFGHFKVRRPPPCPHDQSGPLLRICNWVGHLSQGTKNNVKRGPEKNRNFEKSKNRKNRKIEILQIEISYLTIFLFFIVQKGKAKE